MFRFEIPLGRADEYIFVTTFANDHKVYAASDSVTSTLMSLDDLSVVFGQYFYFLLSVYEAVKILNSECSLLYCR
jgi:hypothetical protein